MKKQILLLIVLVIHIFGCKKSSNGTAEEYNLNLIGYWKSESTETRIYKDKSRKSFEIAPYIYEFQPNGQYRDNSNETEKDIASQTYKLEKIAPNQYALSIEMITKTNDRQNTTFTLNATYNVQVLSSNKIEITSIEKEYKKVIILNRTTTN